MPNYQNTVIYKISCAGQNYVGHTTNYRKRFSRHKSDCTNENGGFDACEFLILEEYPCDLVQAAKLREQHWIKEVNASLNICTPGLTYAESSAKYYLTHKEQLKEKAREYRKTHQDKDKKKEYQREYRAKHPGQKNKHDCKYRAKHREEINEKHREYDAKHRDEINKKRRESRANTKLKGLFPLHEQPVSIPTL
jgi:hypothetical protein